MARPARLWPLLLVLMTPALAGCQGEDRAPAEIPGVEWTVGDRWTYLRTHGDGPAATYHRTVTGLTAQGAQTVYEVREGLDGGPVEQTNRYTVGRLRYVGGEVRDATGIVQSTTPDRPIVYHYLFPLGGAAVHEEARLAQRSIGSAQTDHVAIRATSGAPMALRLGERIYDVVPYRIEIEFLDVPFAGTSVIEGHWAQSVAQSVLTLLHEEGVTTRYELRTFERASPAAGPPAYRLADGLVAPPLSAGFDAALDAPGYVRYLMHVTRPTEVGLRFFVPPLRPEGDAAQIDLAVLRPLGFSGTAMDETLTGLAEPGVVLHVAAAEAGSGQVTLHTPDAAALDAVLLAPGQVYELLLASNRAGMRVDVRLGDDVESRRPAATGGAEVVTVQHRHVRETTGPGPQTWRDSITAVVAVPPEARIEGLVYAVNHGASEAALGEVEANRRVLLRADAFPAQASQALYASFQAHQVDGAFEVEAGFDYQATFAAQGAVDYEIGALLLRLFEP